MEKRFKDRRKLLFFLNVRWMERRLPVRGLYWILRLHAFARAALRGIPDSQPLPACLGATKWVRAVREWRMRAYLNEPLEYFPDRLADPKWMNRCCIEGLDHVLRLQTKQASGGAGVCPFRHLSPDQILAPGSWCSRRNDDFWKEGIPHRRWNGWRMGFVLFPAARRPSIWINCAKRTSFSPPGIRC